MEVFLGLLGTALVAVLGFVAVKLQNIEVILAVAVKTQEDHKLELADHENRIRDLELNL